MGESPALRDDAEVACSVLMPVRNEERHLEASIAAMCGQRFPGRLEFLVIDGGSTDRTRELMAALAAGDPRIRVLSNPRGITSSGLNVGLGHARGRWVARMDAHTEYPEDYLLRGVERLRRGGTRWVSGLALSRGENRVSRAVALALSSPLGRGGSRKWVAREGGDQEYELDSGVFAGVWERTTLLEYGGWDERWVRNQDSEMAGRFLARGETLILVPAMGAHYVPRGTLTALARQYFQYGAFRTRTAARHPHTMRRSHLLAPGVVVTAAAAVIGPRPVRRLATAGMAIYGGALVSAALRAREQSESAAEAWLVVPVLAAMHLGHGAGALVDAGRHGPPLAALAGALGCHRLSARWAPAPQPTFAPSLDEGLAELSRESAGSPRW